jgi:hypothetical protein
LSRLYETLRPFYRPPDALGGDQVDRQALRAALLRLATDLRRLFWVRAAMICVVFIIEIVIGAVYLESPGVLSGIAGAFGLTAAGGIKAMQSVSRDMAEANLLVVLAGELDAETLGHIVDALVTKLTGTRAPRGTPGHLARSRTERDGVI